MARLVASVWWLPICTASDYKESPDGRYVASVSDRCDESFFGNTNRWFEFKVRGGLPQRLITDPIPGPYWGYRGATNTVIYWSDDSTSVRFVFPATEIRMKP